MDRGRICGLIAAAAVLSGCGYEHRPIGPDRPLSDPTGAADPRIRFYDKNAWQVSQGGLHYTHYSCGDCHQPGSARPQISFHGGPQVGFDELYRIIKDGRGAMPAYGQRIPTEQIWQITAYVRSLRTLKVTKRERQDLDQKGEPTNGAWTGPVS